jgi:hypothetical protein
LNLSAEFLNEADTQDALPLVPLEDIPPPLGLGLEDFPRPESSSLAVQMDQGSIRHC